MDVELQILKHLKRSPRATVAIIDQYCDPYNDLFSDVRNYECFKYLHQGIISPIKRKSLPEIAKIVGISSPQSLHHFIANSPWSVEGLKEKRLTSTLKALKEQKIIVVIDETGDRKKGKRATRSKMKKQIGNLYGLRTWVEYGFRQCKQELGWTDYRFTSFAEINKWWEIIFSAYWMVSFHSKVFRHLNQSQSLFNSQLQTEDSISDFTLHQQWSNKPGWKTTLNNLRLIIQPTIFFWMVIPWLDIFPNRSLLLGFHRLISTMNQFYFYLPDG